MQTPDRRTLNLAAVRSQIASADLLLYRPTSLFGWLVQVAGRGWHSHAEMAWWSGDVNGRGTLMAAGMVRGGGRSVPLAGQVHRYPGRIEWWSIRDHDHYDRAGAVREMLRLTGMKYGWWSVAKAMLLHLPIIRAFVRPERGDVGVVAHPPYCSEAVAWACRVGGGVDPVPNLPDRLTEPADLARSLLYRFEGVLVP